MTHRKLIALDFDGVLHAYTSPWTDAATISDPPTPGAILFLKALVDDERFEVVVVSSRLKEPAGMEAVQNWLSDRIDEVFYRAEARRTFAALTFSVDRPPAFLTIDDRAVTFDGTWPDLGRLAAFKPWNKRPAVDLETRMMLVQSRHGHVPVDDIAEHGFQTAVEIGRKRDDAEWCDLLREVARRAYVAGCEAVEFHEEDCQDEVAQVLDDVLGRKAAV